MNIQNMVGYLVFLLACNAGATDIAIDSNTKYLAVRDYFVPTDRGYEAYSVNGFYEPGLANTRPKIFLFPQVSVDTNDVLFIDKNGQIIEKEDYMNSQNISRIIIEPKYNPSLPNKVQGTGISYALRNLSTKGYFPEALRNPNGEIPFDVSLNMNPYNFQLRNFITQSYSEYERQFAEQKEIENYWNQYLVESINYEDLTLQLVVDDVIEESVVKGNILLNNRLPKMIIRDPDQYTLNRILGGTYEIRAIFKFKDSRTSFIDAELNNAQVITNYLSETKEALTQRKSSGWRIFNIGNKNTSIKESIKHQLETKTQVDKKSNTNIIMEDADEDMIKLFESRFFPAVYRDDVIRDHMLAATKATEANQADLAKAHTKYVEMLKDDTENAKIDAAAAAAALSQKNYAEFVAKGVQMYDNNGKITGKYERIISQESGETTDIGWSMTKKFTAKRTMTQFIVPNHKIKLDASLGLCGFTSFYYVKTTPIIPNPIMPMDFRQVPINTFVPTCIIKGGALHRAGVFPGTSFDFVAGKQVQKITDLESLLKKYRAGDKIKLIRSDLPSNSNVVEVILQQGVH